MILCSRCKKLKAADQFNFKKKATQTRQKSCKECTRQEVRNHYQKNREYYLSKAKKRNGENRKIIRNYVWKYLLSHPCVDCGEKDPVVLDFDHQRDKVAAVSMIAQKNLSLTLIKREIEKCQVRCANCHRRKTAHDFKWYKDQHAPVA